MRIGPYNIDFVENHRSAKKARRPTNDPSISRSLPEQNGDFIHPQGTSVSLPGEASLPPVVPTPSRGILGRIFQASFLESVRRWTRRIVISFLVAASVTFLWIVTQGCLQLWNYLRLP